MVRNAKNRRHIKRENRSSPDWIGDAREHEAANSVGATICESDSTYGQSQLKWWVVRSTKDVVNYEYLNCCRMFCDPDFVPIKILLVLITIVRCIFDNCPAIEDRNLFTLRARESKRKWDGKIGSIVGLAFS